MTAITWPPVLTRKVDTIATVKPDTQAVAFLVQVASKHLFYDIPVNFKWC